VIDNAKDIFVGRRIALEQQKQQKIVARAENKRREAWFAKSARKTLGKFELTEIIFAL
jgi:hypothetical protein